MKKPDNNIINIVEIEISAEKVYYTIIGKHKDMLFFLNNINNSNQKNMYLISKLSVPFAYILENNLSIDSSLGKAIIDKNHIDIDSSIENIQCSILCDCGIKEEKDAYVLLCLEKIGDIYVLKLPEIPMKENFEPEKAIIDELELLISDIPKSIRNSLKLVDIFGSLTQMKEGREYGMSSINKVTKMNNTLVYLARMQKEIKKKVKI